MFHLAPKDFLMGSAPPNSTTSVISLLQSIPHVTKWIFKYSNMNIISLTFRIKPSLFRINLFIQVSKALRKLFLAYSPISSLFSLLTCGQILCFLTCPSHSTLRALYKLYTFFYKECPSLLLSCLDHSVVIQNILLP